MSVDQEPSQIPEISGRFFRSSELVIDGRPEGVADARAWSVRMCTILGDPDLAESIKLVVSELVTNATRHSRSYGLTRSIRAGLMLRSAGVLLRVADLGKPAHPNPVPDWIEWSGEREWSGLQIVSLVADRSGYYETIWPQTLRISWAAWLS